MTKAGTFGHDLLKSFHRTKVQYKKLEKICTTVPLEHTQEGRESRLSLVSLHDKHKRVSDHNRNV